MSTPISGLPVASTVTSGDLVPIVQAGVTKKATAGTVVSNLLPVASTTQPGIVQLGTGGSNACQGNDARLSNSRTPTGAAGGDLTGTYPDPELIALCTAGTYGSTSAIPVLTLDTKGRVASIATEQIFVNADNITSGTLSPTRLADSGVTLGTYGSSTQIPVLTLDAKGRIISMATEQIAANASNIITGTLDPARLATSGVTAGVVGNSTQIPVLTLDNKGRVIAASTSQLVVNANNITSGTIDPNRLATSGVVAGTVGSSAQIPVLTVDNKGRVTVATSTPVLPGNNASDLTTGTLDPERLDVSGVSAGTYGSPASVAQFTVDSKGRITGAVDVGISGSAGGTVVAVGAESNTLVVSGSPVIYSGALQLELATTGVSAITAGSSAQSAVITVDSYGRVTALATAAISSLSPSGVVSGSYGHPERVAQFTVDTNGIITSATEAAIAIPAAAVSGLAASATSDTTNAGNIITGTLGTDRIPVLASSQIPALAPSQIPVLASSQISGISAAQISSGITSAQITGISASQVGGAFTSAQISGLAASAFTDTTDASNITSGILSSARISVLASSQISGINITQVQSLGSGVSSFLQTPSSANLITAVTDETGSGSLVFSSTPTISNPTISGYTEGVVAQGTVGAASTLSIASGTIITATLTSATPCTFTMPAVGVGKSFTMYLKQPATGTATTAAFSGVAWSGALAPTITATLGRMDILSFVSDGVKWYGSAVQNFTY
jgi:hypothetical protein